MDDAKSRNAVAVIGVGTIGSSIARHLVASDLTLTLYDARPEAAAPLVDAGGRLAASCADAARDADWIIVAVVDDAQVTDVLTGPDGVLSTARPGSVIVLHSTVRLDTVRDMASAAAAKGVGLIDAGVSTRGDDGTGKLAVFVGGETSEVEAARSLLHRYSHSIEHVGGLGSGMTAKLVRNLLGYSFMVATYESLAFAESMGVDLDAFRRVLRDSDVTSQAQLVMDLPTTKPYTESEEAAAYWKNLTGLAGEELRDLLERAESVMEKDMDEITALAEETGFHMDFTGGTKPLLHHVLLLPDN